MRIGLKLILGFLAVALIGAAVGLFGIANIKSLEAAGKSLYKNATVPLSQLAFITGSANRLRANIYVLINATDPKVGDIYIKKIADRRAVIAGAETAYKASLVGEADTKAFEAYLALQAGFQACASQAMELNSQNKKAEATTVAFGTMEKAINALNIWLEQTIAAKVAAAKLKSEGNSSLAARASILMLVVLGLATLVSIALGLILAASITKPLGLAVRLAGAIAGGDLRSDVEKRYLGRRDEIGELAIALSGMITSLRDIVTAVQASASYVSSGSSEISSTAQDISQGATEQAASAEEVSASVEQMGSTIRQNADNAGAAEGYTRKSAADAASGGGIVLETSKAMKEIAGKIGVIEEIARQTNLLALNAAIEAARAGDAGKGFAVVAAEVRKLAERSQGASREISELSGRSVAVAEEAGRIVMAIVPEVERAAEVVQEISSASQEQGAGIDQIGKAIVQLDTVIQKNASASEELASMSEELSSQAQNLSETLSYFKLPEEEGGRARPVKEGRPARIPARAPAKASTGIVPALRAAVLASDAAFEEF